MAPRRPHTSQKAKRPAKRPAPPISPTSDTSSSDEEDLVPNLMAMLEKVSQFERETIMDQHRDGCSNSTRSKRAANERRMAELKSIRKEIMAMISRSGGERTMGYETVQLRINASTVGVAPPYEVTANPALEDSRQQLQHAKTNGIGVAAGLPLNIGESIHAPKPNTQLLPAAWPWAWPTAWPLRGNFIGKVDNMPVGTDSGMSIVTNRNGYGVPLISSKQPVRNITLASKQTTQDAKETAANNQTIQAASERPVKTESCLVTTATKEPSSTLFTMALSNFKVPSQGDLSVGRPPASFTSLASAISPPTSEARGPTASVYRPPSTIPATPPKPIPRPVSFGSYISATTVEKIVRGDYIDIFTLLNREFDQISYDYADEEEKERMRQKVPDHCWTNWLSAFCIYAGILSTAKPEKGPALFKYMDIIHRAYIDFYEPAWLSYDEEFRREASINQDLPWNERHLDLWLRIMTSKGRGGGPRFDSGHLIPPATAAHPLKPRPQKVCWEYNRKGSCSRKRCRFRHACALCGAAHAVSSCPKGRPT